MSKPSVYNVPLTSSGVATGEWVAVLAESAADAAAAAVMVGVKAHPEAWHMTGFVRMAGDIDEVGEDAEGGEIHSFGPGAAQRLREAVAAKRVERRMVDGGMRVGNRQVDDVWFRVA